ncbi:MAG: hypothetical protein WD716_00185 [Fimbriimonadaceae bacterium]
MSDSPSPYPRTSLPRAAGIKLVELAIVVVLLLIGGAILYPVLMGVTGEGHRRHPLSNLKMLAIANIMYAYDYDERLPPAEAWMDVLGPYTKNEQLFHDPSIKDRKPDEHGLAFFEPLSGIDTRTVLDPDKVPLMFQSVLMGRNAHSDLSTLPAVPRNGKVNYVALLDGHVKGFPPTWPEHPITLVIGPSLVKEDKHE